MRKSNTEKRGRRTAKFRDSFVIAAKAPSIILCASGVLSSEPLRNELVKIRAARLKLDPSKYLREDGCGDIVCITHIALAAHRKTIPYRIGEVFRFREMELSGELERRPLL